jgi:alpha-D-ribose 1-methylphosphonate 5-triphosphate synthase subunit PhnH
VTTDLLTAEAEVRKAAKARALTPVDVQLIFRAVLEALARPGTPRQLPAGPLAVLPPALLPVLALTDLATPTSVLADDDQWAAVVRTMTSAPITDQADARLAAVLRPLASGELAAFRPGSAAAPEEAALVCLAVPGIDTQPVGPGPVWRLQGPGVPGRRLLRVAGLPADFAACRERLVSGYPAGIDLVFSTPRGLVVGVPRTTRVTEEVI